MGSVQSTLSRLGSFLSDCCTLSSNEDRSNPLEPETHQSEPETHQPSPSVASSSSDGCNYDVFLSFRGIDTRKTFTGHLYSALDRAGIKTFLDDNELERGEAIGPKLVEAIEGSKIWIPIFSRNYASSKWCLEELAKMIECRDRQKLWPIFYDVDPSHIRNQTGSFTEAFCRHQKCFEKEKVERWRHALREAGNASGWDLKEATHGYEPRLISIVVKEVLRNLNKTSFDVTKFPVGIESRILKMMKYLQLECNNVLFVGICGLGGIGKTTIATAVLNKISYDFQCVCFLANIREDASQKGIVTLQKQLLRTLHEGYEDTYFEGRGKTIIKERLHLKKVLLILDDVDDAEQLEALAGEPNWFGFGSRIIITTRNERILKDHQVSLIYRPEELDSDQSLQLFSKHAFCNDQPHEDFKELSEEVVKISGGLPLALEIFGSSLFGKEIIEWKNELDKLKKIPPKKVQDRLKLSYEGLDEFEKEIFLDIACFFSKITYNGSAISIWESYGFSPRLGIMGLLHKSLIKIDDNNLLTMHDLICDMGREIVRQQNWKEPTMRSRLWVHEEALGVLTTHTGTNNIEGIRIGMGCENTSNSRLRTEAFASMAKLRLLIMEYAQLEGSFEHLPKGLRHFSWHGCQLEYLPATFHLQQLVHLDLTKSKITILGNSLPQEEKLQLGKLKVLDLSGCTSLIRTGDLSGLPCLEVLTMKDCKRLVEIDESIGHLRRLSYLDLKSCRQLMELPSSMCELKCLEFLYLSYCNKLFEFPENSGTMESLPELLIEDSSAPAIYQPPKEIPDPCRPQKNKIEVLNATHFNRLPDIIISNLRNLRQLSLKGTNIVELPDIICSLDKLEVLTLSGCKELVKLPEDFGMLSNLKKLYMDGCQRLAGSFPASFSALSSLEHLVTSNCNLIERLPDLSKLKCLKSLDLKNCEKIAEIQGLECLEALEEMYMNGCTSLERLPDLQKLKSLKILNLKNCEKLVEIHGLHGLETVEYLEMYMCKSIERFPDLSRLKRLRGFGFSKCEKLVEIQEIEELEALEEIHMNGCTSIERLPHLWKLKKLKKLSLSNCEKFANIQGIKDLEALEELYMNGCTSIEILPDLSRLKSLKIVDLGNCENLAEIHGIDCLEGLEKFYMGGCTSIESLPDLSKLKRLKEFDIHDCEKLESIHGIDCLEGLEIFYMGGCTSIESLPDLSKLKRLKEFDIQDCEKLDEIHGIDCLEGLEKFYMGGCTSIESLPDLSKLKRLKELYL